MLKGAAKGCTPCQTRYSCSRCCKRFFAFRQAVGELLVVDRYTYVHFVFEVSRRRTYALAYKISTISFSPYSLVQRYLHHHQYYLLFNIRELLLNVVKNFAHDEVDVLGSNISPWLSECSRLLLCLVAVEYRRLLSHIFSACVTH